MEILIPTNVQGRRVLEHSIQILCLIFAEVPGSTVWLFSDLEIHFAHLRGAECMVHSWEDRHKQMGDLLIRDRAKLVICSILVKKMS